MCKARVFVLLLLMKCSTCRWGIRSRLHEVLVDSVLLQELSSIVACAGRLVCNFKQGKVCDCKCCSCVGNRSLTVCPDTGAVSNRQWKL